MKIDFHSIRSPPSLLPHSLETYPKCIIRARMGTPEKMIQGHVRDHLPDREGRLLAHQGRVARRQ